MITEEHLEHWLFEIEYALNGIHSHINKKGFEDQMIGESHLSFSYLQEKADMIRNLLRQIRYEVQETKPVV